ncbi:MAG: 50S ribosomal protein L6 [Nanoarchaeota archaeon]
MSTKVKPEIKEEIEIPENVKIELDSGMIKVSGPAGSNERELRHPTVDIQKQNDKLILIAKNQNKNNKRLLKSFKSHISNLIAGVTNIYVYKLKICSGHFPMNVAVSGSNIVIKNFFAEKIPRHAKILKNVNVKIDSDIITVTGTNKELVGQTAANIEQACRITNRDRRVFMDGIYITSKDDE